MNRRRRKRKCLALRVPARLKRRSIFASFPLTSIDLLKLSIIIIMMLMLLMVLIESNHLMLVHCDPNSQIERPRMIINSSSYDATPRLSQLVSSQMNDNLTSQRQQVNNQNHSFMKPSDDDHPRASNSRPEVANGRQMKMMMMTTARKKPQHQLNSAKLQDLNYISNKETQLGSHEPIRLLQIGKKQANETLESKESISNGRAPPYEASANLTRPFPTTHVPPLLPATLPARIVNPGVLFLSPFPSTSSPRAQQPTHWPIHHINSHQPAPHLIWPPHWHRLSLPRGQNVAWDLDTRANPNRTASDTNFHSSFNTSTPIRLPPITETTTSSSISMLNQNRSMDFGARNRPLPVTSFNTTPLPRDFPSLTSKSNEEDQIEELFKSLPKSAPPSESNRNWTRHLQREMEGASVDSFLVTNRSFVNLICGINTMLVRFEFSQPFNGRVLTNIDPEVSCDLRGDGSVSYEWRIGFHECGTRQESSNLFINNLQIQFLTGQPAEEIKTIACSYPLRPRAQPPKDIVLQIPRANISDKLIELIKTSNIDEPALLVEYEPYFLIMGFLLATVAASVFLIGAFLISRQRRRVQMSNGFFDMANGRQTPGASKRPPAASGSQFLRPPLLSWSSRHKDRRSGSHRTDQGPVAKWARRSQSSYRKRQQQHQTSPKMRAEILKYQDELEQKDPGVQRRDSLAELSSVTTIEIPLATCIKYTPEMDDPDPVDRLKIDKSKPQALSHDELATDSQEDPGGPDRLDTDIKLKPKTSKANNQAKVRLGSIRSTLTTPQEYRKLQSIVRLFDGGRKWRQPAKSQRSLDIIGEMEPKDVAWLRKKLTTDELFRSHVLESKDEETFNRKLENNPLYEGQIKADSWQKFRQISQNESLMKLTRPSNFNSAPKPDIEESPPQEDLHKAIPTMVTLEESIRPTPTSSSTIISESRKSPDNDKTPSDVAPSEKEMTIHNTDDVKQEMNQEAEASPLIVEEKNEGAGNDAVPMDTMDRDKSLNETSVENQTKPVVDKSGPPANNMGSRTSRPISQASSIGSRGSESEHYERIETRGLTKGWPKPTNCDSLEDDEKLEFKMGTDGGKKFDRKLPRINTENPSEGRKQQAYRAGRKSRTRDALLEPRPDASADEDDYQCKSFDDDWTSSGRPKQWSMKGDIRPERGASTRNIVDSWKILDRNGSSIIRLSQFKTRTSRKLDQIELPNRRGLTGTLIEIDSVTNITSSDNFTSYTRSSIEQGHFEPVSGDSSARSESSADLDHMDRSFGKGPLDRNTLSATSSLQFMDTGDEQL